MLRHRPSSIHILFALKLFLLLLVTANTNLSATASYTPHRYLEITPTPLLGNQAWRNTLKWRHTPLPPSHSGVDNILNTPHPKFDLVKLISPHFFAGRDVDGYVVFVQRPGRALFDKTVLRKSGVSVSDLVFHYVFVIEYCWSILDGQSTNGLMTSIIDLEVSLTPSPLALIHLLC